MSKIQKSVQLQEIHSKTTLRFYFIPVKRVSTKIQNTIKSCDKEGDERALCLKCKTV